MVTVDRDGPPWWPSGRPGRRIERAGSVDVSGQDWGRVDADGTVWVRTGEGERPVGQFPGASEQEALAYFTRKFEDLAAQVSLLEQRLDAGQVSAADADTTLTRLRGAVAEAHAVGDLDGLAARVDSLGPKVAAKREEADAVRAKAREQALAQRSAVVAEAEQLAETDPERMAWKQAGDRLRELFEQWQKLQREARLDKHSEDQLWKRFSHARSTFDRKRRHWFGALDEQRAQARAVKEELVAQAEALSTSTDWGPTAGAYRALMDRWKAAGRAARKEDDALWARFRAAQDVFFGARNAATSEADAEQRENLAAKEAVLAEAETLLPVSDPVPARAALRGLQERWDAAGKVPRADLQRVEARMRAVEQAVRAAEESRWARSNPEARARAEGMVTQLEKVMAGLQADLDRARAGGQPRRIAEAEQALAARQEWLDQARRALQDFTA